MTRTQFQEDNPPKYMSSLPVMTRLGEDSDGVDTDFSFEGVLCGLTKKMGKYCQLLTFIRAHGLHSYKSSKEGAYHRRTQLSNAFVGRLSI